MHKHLRSDKYRLALALFKKQGHVTMHRKSGIVEHFKPLNAHCQKYKLQQLRELFIGCADAGDPIEKVVIDIPMTDR